MQAARRFARACFAHLHHAASLPPANNSHNIAVCVALVCKRWRRLCDAPSLWVYFDLRGPVQYLSWPELAGAS